MQKQAFAVKKTISELRNDELRMCLSTRKKIFDKISNN